MVRARTTSAKQTGWRHPPALSVEVRGDVGAVPECWTVVRGAGVVLGVLIDYWDLKE